jgi:DNA-binding CsgD family transcriptional regulator
LISNECTNREIEDRLCFRVSAEVGHRENVIEKIKAKNTVGIVMYATRHGLI